MYIDETQLCSILGISRESARKYRLEGGLPYCTLPGGGIRYESDAVRAWMNSSIDLDSGREKFAGVYASARTIECAFARGVDQSVGAASYDARTLEMSTDQFPEAISLRELVHGFALRAGYDDPNSIRDIRAQMQCLRGAAINAAASGPSTMSLESVLSNVANKFVRAGFLGVDRTAIDAISAPRSTKDFRNSPSYRLSGDLTYKKVPGGEIDSGDIDAIAADNSLETFARLVAIPRSYLLNDDAGFFEVMLKRGLGRGAALAFGEVFWSVFLGDPTFWNAANKNLLSGAASALDVASLGEGVKMLESQVDERGAPCNITAAWLITSSEHKIVGQRLVGDEKLVMTGSDGTTTSKNPYTKLQHASSPYLGSAAIVNADEDAWWVAASVDDTPTAEIYI